MLLRAPCKQQSTRSASKRKAKGPTSSKRNKKTKIKANEVATKDGDEEDGAVVVEEEDDDDEEEEKKRRN